jgi:mannose-6-phosphate isomerase-like protein (cupin superfamily)
METVGIPIHRGYYVEDLRTVELGWWEERQCNAAFIQLMGQEGVSEARVSEIPPVKTLPPTPFALDEVVYVVEGEGVLHLGGASTPIAAGSCIHLPPLEEHCLENTGERPLRVLGVFHPSGDPASRASEEASAGPATSTTTTPLKEEA